jgi:hypothetical protein
MQFRQRARQASSLKLRSVTDACPIDDGQPQATADDKIVDKRLGAPTR